MASVHLYSFCKICNLNEEVRTRILIKCYYLRLLRVIFFPFSFSNLWFILIKVSSFCSFQESIVLHSIRLFWVYFYFAFYVDYNRLIMQESLLLVTLSIRTLNLVRKKKQLRLAELFNYVCSWMK